MKAFLLLLPAILLTSALAGCGMGHDCTLMLPRCALDVALESDAWQPGAYELELHADDAVSRCTADLPLVDGAAFTCDEPGGYFSWPPDMGNAVSEWPKWVSFHTAPRKATIVIRRDGLEIARQSFEPRYAKTEPNGEGCGVCKNADATMSF